MEDLQLRYISELCEGIKRIRRGKGFLYFDENGERIQDPLLIQRIRSLGIPPNWKSVWICPELDGHIQATGLDVKNRKQYIYHPEWRKYRSASKFNKIKEFAQWLPDIRRKAYDDLRLPDWPRNKVLGLIILTLDEALIRIGNTFYRDENDTFGLTTLRRRHLQIEKKQVIFEFKAKSGKYSKVNIKNNKLVKLIKECSELPGYEVFRYRENGSTIPVTSADVNQYLREITSESFSSKDFRTWGGTVLAIEKYSEAKKMTEENKRLKLDTTLVKLVAAKLGNTQAICREYYIHPAVMQAVEADDYEKMQYEKVEPATPYELTSAEKKALDIIGE